MEKTVQIGNIDINYEEYGNPDGAPVIILHGWGCNINTVRSIAACLEDSMRVFSLDLPGHGKSSEPVEIWGTKDFAGLVMKFITLKGLKNPSLIGHSFGGRTSISLAAGNEDISRLVLIDSAGITPKRSLKYYYKVNSFKALKKIANLLLGREKAGRIIEKSLQKKGSADYKSASPKMRAIMSKCVNEDLRHVFPEIKSPTLLIWGEEDKATPISDARLMEKNIPDAGLVSFPGCGHFSFLDNPYQFRAVLRSFFDL